MLAQPMSQLDILNLARSSGQTISSDFAQVITITFAMVVAIYYFLHQAGIRMKISPLRSIPAACSPIWG